MDEFIGRYIGFIISAVVAATILLIFTIRSLRIERRHRRALEERFQAVLDVEAEAARLQKKVDEQHAATDTLRQDYKEKRQLYDHLLREVAIFDEKLAFAELGIYEPHFDFDDSEAFKDAIRHIRDEQKKMVSEKNAVICTTEWMVEGSRAKGRTMTNRNIRLTLRAFNNECDAAIANARWNNVNAMEKRIFRAQDQIDKLNESNTIFIVKNYVKLKLKELYLTHEYREKLKEEREKKAEIARVAREERRLLRDLEDAEKEEDRYVRLLAKARAEAAEISGPQLERLARQVEGLERDLADAHAKVERAKALAEQTHSGYVYIISNIGSFGSDVVKIGLTRRLDPMDRVRELGDASVPFTFDIHAIIYSDNAPSLESALHAEFNEWRINTRNQRKEFFRVSIDDVENAVKRLAPAASFFRDVEAQEYHETLAKRQMELERQNKRELLPQTI